MLDDSFCCLRSLIFGEKIRMEFPKVPCLKAYKVLWFDGLGHMHTNVYAAVYACGCSCQVPVANEKNVLTYLHEY